MMNRLAERVIDNPAMSGGLVVMALTAAAVVSNAVFLQKVQHPEPWFMTRPAPIATPTPTPREESTPLPVPEPRPRAEATIETMIEPPGSDVPTPVASKSLEQYPPPAAETAPRSSTDVIIALQQELANRGLYTGAVDGISGSRTQAAITAYQQALGLPVTGEPSVEVLDHIRTASIQPGQPEPETAASPAPVTQPVEALAPQPVAAVVPEPLADAAPSASDPLASEIEIARRNRYLTVQRALNRIGYGPLAEDGRASEKTENAIRRFELDNGLPITGAPEDAVIERLVGIGAIEQT